MIDLKIIKPGDRIVFRVYDGCRCFAEDGILAHEINDGDVFVVADPISDECGRYVRVACSFFKRGFFLSDPGHCSIVAMDGYNA